MRIKAAAAAADLAPTGVLRAAINPAEALRRANQSETLLAPAGIAHPLYSKGVQ